VRENIYSWVDSSRDVDSGIVKVNLFDKEGGAMILDSSVVSGDNFEGKLSLTMSLNLIDNCTC